jgi:hypothetical protein
MKKFPIIAALAVLAAGFCSGHAQAAEHTRKADCLLLIQGKPWINGPCDFTPTDMPGEPKGSFYLSVPYPRPNGRFVYLNVWNDGTAQGSWNDPDSDSHAHDPIGTGSLFKAGACWESDANNKVCAWKPGERRWFKDMTPAEARYDQWALAKETEMPATQAQAAQPNVTFPAGTTHLVCHARDNMIDVIRNADGEWSVLHLTANGGSYQRATQYDLHDYSNVEAGKLAWLGYNNRHPDTVMTGAIESDNNTYVERLWHGDPSANSGIPADNFQTIVAGCDAPAPVAAPAPAPVAAAIDMHSSFAAIGDELYQNAVCKNGQPIHLADLPMDPRLYAFWKANKAQAHDWAMEGIREAGNWAVKCGDLGPSTAMNPIMVQPAS